MKTGFKVAKNIASFALSVGYLNAHTVIYSLKSFKHKKINSTNVQNYVTPMKTHAMKGDTKSCLTWSGSPQMGGHHVEIT